MVRSAEELQHLQERSRLLEIDGLRVKTISSNIRPPINWSCVHIQPEGIAREGDLLLVKALTNCARNQIENTDGRDDRIYSGDHFVGVVANRHSGTSESGDVPQ